MSTTRRGPKYKEINWDEFDKLCAIQCTLREIAGWFQCSEDTVERAVHRVKKMKFAEYYEQKKGPGKISLRRKQFELAQSGNVSMLIWLGKQVLEQSEKIDTKNETTVSGDMTFNIGFEDEYDSDPKDKS